mgnify:CR=1 FL=1
MKKGRAKKGKPAGSPAAASASNVEDSDSSPEKSAAPLRKNSKLMSASTRSSALASQDAEFREHINTLSAMASKSTRF